MPVETLGEARSQGWRVTVRCADGRTESPRSQSSRECSYRMRAGHGDAGVDAGPGVSTVAAGKPAALSALRLALCCGALRAAAPRRDINSRP